MHENEKQPVASRLAKASANQIYGLKQFEGRGPFPVEFKAVNGANRLHISYDKGFRYKGQADKSGNMCQVLKIF